jgi:hypothetical protein
MLMNFVRLLPYPSKHYYSRKPSLRRGYCTSTPFSYSRQSYSHRKIISIAILADFGGFGSARHALRPQLDRIYVSAVSFTTSKFISSVFPSPAALFHTLRRHRINSRHETWLSRALSCPSVQEALLSTRLCCSDSSRRTNAIPRTSIITLECVRC